MTRRGSKGRNALIAWILVASFVIGTVGYATQGFRVSPFAAAPASPGGTPNPGGGNYPLSGGIVQDINTGSALGATTTIDVINPTNWNAPVESPTQSSGTWASKGNYPAGTVLYFHVSSTASNKYYDGLFGPYTMGTAPFTAASTTSCTSVCVWSAPIMGIYQESTAANVKFTLTDSLGKSCATASGNSAGSQTTDQAGSVGANTVNLLLTIQLAGSTSTAVTNYGIATPWIYAGSVGPANNPLVNNPLSLVMWIGYNFSAAASSWVTGSGFQPTAVQPSSSVGPLVYKVLPPLTSTRAAGAISSISVPLDLTNGPGSGKHAEVAIWVTDLQNPADSTRATPDGAPTAFGAYSTTGPSAVAFSFSSFTTGSGRWTGYLIACGVTQ